MKKVILLVICLLFPSVAHAVFDLPDGSCPSDCRKVEWSSGLDLDGGLPVYDIKEYARDFGAIPNDGVNDHNAIQQCLNAVSTPGACMLEPGEYRINGDIRIPSQVALRGAGGAFQPNQTTLKILSESSGYGERIQIAAGKNHGSRINITVDPPKNASTLTLANTSGLSAGDYISIYEDRDPTIPVSPTNDCSWCGEDNGQGHFMQQFSKITAINGKVITIDPPLYYDYNSSYDPEVRKVTFGVYRAGVEYLKIDNSSVNSGVIAIANARHSWLKGVETYMAGGNSGEAHVRMAFSHGIEIRDSYFHDGKSFSSGANYGVFLIYWNSGHKIENNVFRSLRHGVNFEGGGSGVAVLYNYFDNHYEAEEPPFLDADLNPNHGPHPHMNLLEGNSSAKIVFDVTMGSSSHNVAFRNHVRGERSSPATGWGVWAIDTQLYNKYNSYVGNALGNSSWTSGTYKADGVCEPEEPTALKFGCAGQPGSYEDSSVEPSTLLHGNYDYVTDSVQEWDGGSDHVLPDSLYYNATTVTSIGAWWCSETPWPPIGPDVSGIVNDIPAKRRLDGSPCTISVGKKPAPPTDLTGTVN